MASGEGDRPVFVVTGGSRGIGAAIAAAAAGAGYAVLLTYAGDAGSAGEVVARIEVAGGVARALRADTALVDDVAALFAAADDMGRLAALAYSGGITGKASPLVDAEPADVARVIAVNLTGAMLCAREAIARMSTARGGAGGAIVFLSSRASDYGSPGEHVWYAASKGGIDSLTRGLARELGKEGIRVNAVSPGPVATGMLDAAKQERAAGLSPIGRIGTPEEIADAALFLATEASRYVTGHELVVDGGLTINGSVGHARSELAREEA
jgi:NAD(P)-dependent dehydrogenase (short-subunit alcohol dehydrogenase family)